MQQPRPEYPRPQFVREDWLNLNGEWAFEVDQGDSGEERGLRERELSAAITVPFAPESALSGVGNTDFLNAVWYRRTVTIPAEWQGRDAVLHFGAVDHDATVWVNGIEVARHRGGFTPFSAPLRGVVLPGEDATIVVRARDTKDAPQARGKQATWYRNSHCVYTRTTGIWQTVWLEPVARVHLQRPRITPHVGSSSFTVVAPVSVSAPAHAVRVTLSDADGVLATAEASVAVDRAAVLTLPVPADRLRLWGPVDPHLYDLLLEVVDGTGGVVDTVRSYAGLRSVTVDGDAILLNGEHVFQRLVLDQGYWPDSLMTAPTDAALARDIELGLSAGFNGARLHEKVFEERYLYHCDRLGYLVWAEFGDWGVSGMGPTGANQQPSASFVTQWLEALERDYSHPSIIGWCPLNETHQLLHDRITVLDDVTRGMFLATKLADPSRPVLDTSGYSHRVRETDVWDAHSYEQDPGRFGELLAGLAEGRPFGNRHSEGEYNLPYAEQPYFVSEFGGIWWNAALAGTPQEGQDSWGYGERVRTEQEFAARFTGLVDVLLDDAGMFGYCYTQLTDVFQEQNGLYDFDRRPKFDLDRLRAVQTRRAAYEERRRG